jgi:choline dehydrogenase-like flavoprotein
VIHTSADVKADVDVTCDVCIVGSGAGGAVLAAGLVERGLRVVMLEEGGHRTRKDFDLREGSAYPRMYQERGTRATADLAITILQGRTVGGSTTVNWTTCFRTPERILEHWATKLGIEGWSGEELAPHFDAIEARLHIAEWPEGLANANNRVLLDGARKLGWEAKPLRRNVNGCANSGYCGVGCPVDGKQSMLVTYLPEAVDQGLELYADTRAVTLETAGDRVVAVHGEVLDTENGRPTGVRVVVRPKVTAVCGGAINSPALLLRSGLPEGGVGRKTWLHPVVGVAGVYPHVIQGWSGAPQSVGSHQFIDRGPDKVGFFLETPPLQPMLAATGSVAFGAAKQDFMARLPHLSSLIALSVDGLVPGDEGGTVSLRSDGRIRVDYPIGPHLVESFRAATEAMARVHLAAGATDVISLHQKSVVVRSEADLPALAAAPYGAHQHTIFTAHQMGGCVMGNDPASSVVRPDLRHHRIGNLYVVDGSVLPTALGVNPSETLYGIAHRSRDRVASAV